MNEDNSRFLLINSKVLPRVYTKVLNAKELLASKKAKSSSEACKMCDISRSVFYKYRNYVFPYQDLSQKRIFTFRMRLSDNPGVLSNVLTSLYTQGANVLTVNQNIPNGQIANVTISVTLENHQIEIDTIITALYNTKGVNLVEMI